MRKLLHLWLSAPSRMVRVALAEKQLDFHLKIEETWLRRPDFLALNPAGEVPVMIETDGETSLAGARVICEYLDEIKPQPPLFGTAPLARAEVRRLVDWFETKFGPEVTDNLIGEKIMKRFLRLGTPDSSAIRAGKSNINYHLDYIGYLTDRRKWLGGDQFSLADIAAAAHLSCIDYLGDVPWSEHEAAKDWYARIKSRPSFRALLSDHIPGVSPPKHYADLDF
ncbi:glutathione S-transferase family protein [Magnetospira sp. QH-2]|uniref:glutathione S-transferase family protein n=1 Tax=Magnetospira sp. (strain QH-2) TaxID=1288970 RepID=UPI0005FA09F1|nr:glutathione S-transferase family protein [Magnetospira sp. QH-2]